MKGIPEVNDNILQITRELVAASGPQCFAQILTEVRRQCVGINNELGESHRQVKAHIAYLISLGSLIEQSDEFGVVYGQPGDF